MSIYRREEMSRLVKWVFGAPLIVILFLALSLIMPTSASGYRMVLVLNILSYCIFLMVAMIVIRYFLKFPLGKLFCFERPFYPRNLFLGLAGMGVMGVGTSFIWMALAPDKFSFALQGGWPLDFLLSIIVVILAALLEEILCRSYIAYFVKDELETRTKQKILYCLASGAAFMVFHFQNPETASAGFAYAYIFYFLMGFSLMAVYLATGGIEAPLGIHIANNLVNALFFTYPDAALKTNALFLHDEPPGPLMLVQAAVCIAASVFICIRFAERSQKAA